MRSPEHPCVKIQIAVAISDTGLVECIPVQWDYLRSRDEYAKFKTEKYSDSRRLWQISVITAHLPVPWEAMFSEENIQIMTIQPSLETSHK